MSRVVILGWDGLDIEMMERFGLTNAFGQHQKKIETYCNPIIEEPHTKELWPSMITGVHPDVHGIEAVAEDGVAWDSSLLDTISTLANGIIPDSILTPVGAKLRQHGVGVAATTAEYYDENGIPTVFDEIGGRAISIPNYQTDYDRAHELDADRNDVWRQIAPERIESGGKRPTVSTEKIEALLYREVSQRVGLTRGRVGRDPLIWTWFGLLDTVGHIQPALGDEFVKEWYKTAARMTQSIRQTVDDDTTVVCVSDHGIQNGDHTHYATIASDDPDPVEEIDHVFGVADWLRQQEFSGEFADREVAEKDREAIRDDLEALGYV